MFTVLRPAVSVFAGCREAWEALVIEELYLLDSAKTGDSVCTVVPVPFPLANRHHQRVTETTQDLTKWETRMTMSGPTAS